LVTAFSTGCRVALRFGREISAEAIGSVGTDDILPRPARLEEESLPA
jgi:hypothetical protein